MLELRGFIAVYPSPLSMPHAPASKPSKNRSCNMCKHSNRILRIQDFQFNFLTTSLDGTPSNNTKSTRLSGSESAPGAETPCSISQAPSFQTASPPELRMATYALNGPLSFTTQCNAYPSFGPHQWPPESSGCG